jgi:hypothetical protein
MLLILRLAPQLISIFGLRQLSKDGRKSERRILGSTKHDRRNTAFIDSGALRMLFELGASVLFLLPRIL